MKEKILDYWNQKPLKSILILAIFIRLIASVFSSGYAMHDDHFLIIESSSSWASDTDYNNWLPSSQRAKGIENPTPEGHSLLYPGVHYLFFECAEFIGVKDPKILMFVIRLAHAFLSLLVVLVSFKITEKLSSTKTAKIVGVCIALGWAFPFYGVRNLTEMVCIPFLLYGIWQIVKIDLKDEWKAYIIAGILFGAAFSVRLQLAVFYLLFGLCMLFLKKWKGSIGLILGFLIGSFLTQGVIDYFIWGKPFAELIEYISYNSGDAMFDYGGAWQWYKYIVVLSFFSFPILGTFWLFGATQQFKKLFWLTIPLIGYTIFHTMYPNQQERFIFSVLPIFMIVGVIGWESFRLKSKFWNKKNKLWKVIHNVAWVANIIMVLGAATYATKQAKVNSSYYFYEQGITKTVNLLHEDSFGDESWYRGNATMLPRFYSGNWNLKSAYINDQSDREAWEKNEKNSEYLLLHGPNHLDKRIDYFKSIFPNMEIMETFESSGIDKLLHWLNPKNRNSQVVIIKTNLESE